MSVTTLVRTLELGWGLGAVAGVATVTFLSIVIGWVALVRGIARLASRKHNKESFS